MRASIDSQERGDSISAQVVVKPKASRPRGGGIRDRYGRARPWELWSLAAVVLGFCLAGGALILRDAPLGHDESVYALRTRYFAGEGYDGGYWNNYRAPGLPLFLSVLWWAGGSGASLRAGTLALAAIGVVLLWVWTRSLLGPRAALFAALLLAVTPGYLRYGWQIALDIPSATLGLAAVIAFDLSSRGHRIRPWALLAVPLAAAATAVRYGGPLHVGPALAVVALVRWPAVRRSIPMILSLGMATLAAMAAILYVPAVTGSRVAPVLAFQGRQAAKDLPYWQSYLDFAAVAPALVGWVVGLVVVAGLGVACVGAVRGWVQGPPVLLGLGSALLFVVALNHGLAQGFAQYLTPALPFVTLAVAAGLHPLLQRLAPRPLLVLTVLLATLGGVAAFRDAAAVTSYFRSSFGPLQTAATRLGGEADGECAVLTTYGPQVGWYSGCRAQSGFGSRGRDPAAFRELLSAALHRNLSELPPETEVFSMLLSQGKRQPQGETLAFLQSLSQGRVFTVGRPGDPPRQYVEVDRLGLLGELRTELPEALAD